MIINGFRVEFPKDIKPFPPQIAVMNKILTALKRKQHALIESPTGTGKTLSLLSSVLAWYVETRENNMKELEKELNEKKESSPSSVVEINQKVQTPKKEQRTPDILNTSNSDDDFESPPPFTEKMPMPMKYEVETHPVEAGKQEKVEKFKCQIIYVTRTHSQIKQVIKEFRRSPYSSQVRMTVLSSRKYSCIHPKAKSCDKNEFCENISKDGIII